MKKNLVVYNAAIGDEIDDCLARIEIESYTIFPKLHGKGRLSGLYMGTHIWPATNSALLIACEDEKVQHILEEESKLKSSMKKVGVRAFVMPLEDMV